MIVYDVTNDQSFNACAKWIDICQKKKTTNKMIGKLCLMYCRSVSLLTTITAFS